MRPCRDFYWRFQHCTSSDLDSRRQVKAADYEISSRATTEYREAVLRRVDRQLPDYEKCTAGELQVFALNRKLIHQKTNVLNKKLVEILETADEERDFPQFMSLPPELRCQVYDWYMASFPRTLQTPTQPPLARSCKLMRTELLPLFYKSFQFKLNLQMNRNFDRFDFSARARDFLLSVAEKDIAQIPSFVFAIESDPHFGIYYFVVELDSLKGGNGATVKSSHAPRAYLLGDPTGKISAAFQDAIAGQYSHWNGQDKKNLTIYDIWAVKKKIKETVFRG